MKFKVYRTSQNPCGVRVPEPPCSGAKLSKQKPAYVYKGEVYYYFDYEIELNSLEDLIQFTKEYGEVIFDGVSIEIYDDYRE